MKREVHAHQQQMRMHFMLIMTAVRIPHDQLSKQALHGVIEEFITRESTDYGAFEVSMETKVRQVYQNLASGNAVLVFDNKTETCNILHKNDPLLKDLEPWEPQIS